MPRTFALNALTVYAGLASETQSALLVGAKELDPSGVLLSSWSSTADQCHCAWPGVTCSGIDGAVTSL
jgi:hypothetical protein